jgi:hypothetical protein
VAGPGRSDRYNVHGAVQAFEVVSVPREEGQALGRGNGGDHQVQAAWAWVALGGDGESDEGPVATDRDASRSTEA